MSRRDELRPWHYDDPFFQDVPQAAGVDLDPYLVDASLDELTLRTFDGMGLDVRGVLGRSDLVPRDRKIQHAFCIDVDRAGDVRVLSNNVPGARWAETMLHEFGHAVYFDGVDRELPWLLRTMHLCLTEGVAMRCGRMVHEPEWLREVARLPEPTVDELAPRLQAGASRRAVDLRPVGAGDDALRARPLREPATGRTTSTGGTSSNASSSCAGPTIATRPTGRPRSTSPWRPSTTTTTCSVSWSPPSSLRPWAAS